MRNVFENLDFIKEFDGEEKIDLINKMQFFLYEEFSHKKRIYKPFQLFHMGEILTRLQESKYLVLTDNTIFKGKNKIVKGRLVLADKSSLFSFFQKENNSNEETVFICMPLLEMPNYIIANDDDWNFYYIELSNLPFYLK